MRPQHWLYTIPLRIRSLFKRHAADSDLDDELQFHIEQKTQEFISKGLSEKEARYAALREFRGVEQAKENCRDQRKVNWLQDLAQDLRYGLRMLRKTPGFTAVAILTLALGIGANTAIFSLIDAVLLKSLPVQKPEELVILFTRLANEDNHQLGFSNPVWQQIRDHQQSFSGIFAEHPTEFDLARGGESHNIKGLFVSGDFFNMLGIRPTAGRLLTTTDDFRSCPATAVLSYSFWQEYYGGAPNAIGNTLTLNRHPFQVVGVSPPGFFGVTVGNHFDVAVPICAEALVPLPGEPNGQKLLDRPSARWLAVMARMKPGVPLEKANAGLKIISPEIFEATVSPEWKSDWQKEFLGGTVRAEPAANGPDDLRDYYAPLKTLMIVVGLVLLVACANIASLMLARASTRLKEIAVRLTMGASRSRLIRQLLTECVLLSSLGALLGILLARWGCALLVRFISTSQDKVFLQLSLDGRILGFTAATAIAVGLLFGLLPALRSTRVSLTSAMKGAQSDESQRSSHWGAGRWIVSTQIAISLVILVAAGLFLRSFRNLATLDLGFDRSNVLLVETTLPLPDDSPTRRANISREILEGLKSLPGATSASESVVTPVSGYMWGLEFSLPKGGGPTGEDASAYMNFVSPEYFATFRSPILAGRGFNDHDVAGAPSVIIINEAMAHRFFSNSQPIGQFLITDDVMKSGPRQKTQPLQIVGVLKDSKYRSLREGNESIAYFPMAQSENLDDARNFEVRTTTDPAAFSKSTEQVFTGINKNISLNFQTLETQVDDSLRQDHLLATLSGFFGALALLLAMIGLYGVLAYTVTQRRKEFGIRIALGAQKTSIVRLIMRDVAILLGVGISVGLGISYWATQLMQKMLFGLSGRDTATMVISAALLVSVAILAAYLPTRRATQTDPMLALRDE